MFYFKSYTIDTIVSVKNKKIKIEDQMFYR